MDYLLINYAGSGIETLDSSELREWEIVRAFEGNPLRSVLIRQRK